MGLPPYAQLVYLVRSIPPRSTICLRGEEVIFLCGVCVYLYPRLLHFWWFPPNMQEMGGEQSVVTNYR